MELDDSIRLIGDARCKVFNMRNKSVATPHPKNVAQRTFRKRLGRRDFKNTKQKRGSVFVLNLDLGSGIDPSRCTVRICQYDLYVHN